MKLENAIQPTTDEMKKASGMSKQAATSWVGYCKACRIRYTLINSILESAFDHNFNHRDILDWGCAAGGVAIILEDETEANITAADVDKHSLRWLQKTCKNIACVELDPCESLPFDDQSFDAIYGISVLTHIPIELQEFYLSELSRIIKKNGTVIITLLSNSACESNKKNNPNPNLHPQDQELLDSQGIIYTPYPEQTLKNMDFSKNKSSSYGLTYHSRDYIHELFDKYFIIDSIEELGLPPQDVLTLRKK